MMISYFLKYYLSSKEKTTRRLKEISIVQTITNKMNRQFTEIIKVNIAIRRMMVEVTVK